MGVGIELLFYTDFQRDGELGDHRHARQHDALQHRSQRGQRRGLTRYMSGAGSNTGTARFNLYQAAEGALRGNTQAWTLWAEQGRGRRR